MAESEDPIYRIICRRSKDYCLASRGGNVVFALTNPLDRYQHWTKDERHGTRIKDSEGQPAFALVNRATGEAISYFAMSKPVPLVPYNENCCENSVLWTMSKDVLEGFGHIRRANRISEVWTAREHYLFDGHIIDLCVPQGDPENVSFHWKIEKLLPSTCISLFRPSQNTVQINCQAKVGYNLAIDKDCSTVLLVPSNPKDIFQHWIKEMAYGVPVKDEEKQEAFALVNKATGKAIKHGFGNNYLVQVAPFNRNHIDPSLLWTQSYYVPDSFRKIRMQNNIHLVFNMLDKGLGKYPLLGLSKNGSSSSQLWNIEDF
ncbi:ricin B-like lectin R40C1 [Carex rostrata]